MFSRASLKGNDKGFTLVELLIVVAIIAILAAIAIPQFTKYRLRGYKSELDSDLKNAYNAAQAYISDFPYETVDTLSKIKEAGYVRSQNVELVSANMTLGNGEIILRSTPLNATEDDNNAVAYANGNFNFVQMP